MKLELRANDLHRSCAQCANDYIKSGVATKFEKSKAKTNLQRIKEMNEEEMADFLERWALGDIDYSKTFCDLCHGQYDCHDDCLMEWLRGVSE